MKIKGAVLRNPGPGAGYSIEELELDAPKEKEALVKYVYTGYCHSDLHNLLGEINMVTPFVAGHECAGIVEEVGPGCTKIKKGDHVVGTWMVPCGECPQCRRGMGNICSGTFKYFVEGMMLDGTSRIKDKDGKMVRHGNFVSGFSNYSVVPEGGLIPLPKEFPLEYGCLMGCCIPTGWGTVTNSAKVQPGDSVAIWGLGGVGLNILRACALRQASPVIAVDLEESKEDLAKEFGATHFICNAKEDPVPKIMEITGGAGADFAFEAIGDPGAIVQAYWSIGAGGTLCIPGITPADQTTNLPLQVLPFGNKSILGNLYGMISTHVDIPKLTQMAMTHDLKLDKLVTNKFKLEDINDVAEKMLKRQIRGRWAIEWD
ncbi:MAG: NDMA-dependent alcohol dehydrogenase [Syntrophorhabdaceae bacterium PtaU1.Bin034]|nr:MAG: NDMA-dependent alcohol dehydrogenase [Syntrophorhabdaceae bacterium PtaU1.Bin034]